MLERWLTSIILFNCYILGHFNSVSWSFTLDFISNYSVNLPYDCKQLHGSHDAPWWWASHWIIAQQCKAQLNQTEHIHTHYGIQALPAACTHFNANTYGEYEQFSWPLFSRSCSIYQWWIWEQLVTSNTQCTELHMHCRSLPQCEYVNIANTHRLVSAQLSMVEDWWKTCKDREDWKEIIQVLLDVHCP